MPNQLRKTEKRFEKRLDIELPITLPNRKVKSKNVSPRGIYFEITTDDIDNYSTGKAIYIEIITSTYTHEISGQIIKITGIGIITRIDKLFSYKYCEKLGVALKFSKKLELSVENERYYSWIKTLY